MFTQAGFDSRVAFWRVWARVSIRGGRRTGWARVIQFASGDLAWYSKRAVFLCWGSRGVIQNHTLLWGLEFVSIGAPQSRIDCAKAVAWRAGRTNTHERVQPNRPRERASI